MKNICQAKELRMKTVFITRYDNKTANMSEITHDNHGNLFNDLDSSVDLSMESINQFRERLPGLWKMTPHFP